MKKALSFALALIMLAAALAGCAGAPGGAAHAAISANIRVTSSDAADAAAWLTARLDAIPDRVVLGTDADGYGVDTSALEDDGYFIRNLGGEVALFARTADGLDRAVRKYAKTVESGAAVEDVTYHEGYRIKRIEIAGRDISEYTIFCEDDKYMPAAAREFAARIAEACGATLAVSTGEPAAPYIALRYVRDDALSTVGYRWTVDGDGLTIECSDGYKAAAPRYAVERFLEKRLDWFGLCTGCETLTPSELVSIGAGESGGETNAFKYSRPYGDNYCVGEKDTLNCMLMWSVLHCVHGLQHSRFGGSLSKSPNGDWSQDQPCWLDEEFLEVSTADVIAYVESRLEGGAVIGGDFGYVDISAGDNGNWCNCRKCSAMLRTEGSVSASVVTWANALSEAVNEEYPGLAYGILAYSGTNKPPKTVVPNDLIYITFCYDMSCDIHTHSGADCTGAALLSTSNPNDHRSVTLSEYLENWTKISDNMYVSFYGMELSLHSASYVSMIVEDMRYFASVGVAGLFWESEDAGFSTGKVSKWLMAELVWNIGMTDEEVSAYLDRVLFAIYGADAAPLVREYIEATETVQKNGPCSHCWFNAVGEYGVTPTLAYVMWADGFDTFFGLIETARLLAETKMQEWRLTKLSMCCIYNGCLASYFAAYDAGDDARCAELCGLYAMISERLTEFGFDPATIWGTKDLPYIKDFGIWDDLELLAWTAWAEYAPRFMYMELPTREMPERVAEIIAEHESN